MLIRQCAARRKDFMKLTKIARSPAAGNIAEESTRSGEPVEITGRARRAELNVESICRSGFRLANDDAGSVVYGAESMLRFQIVCSQQQSEQNLTQLADLNRARHRDMVGVFLNQLADRLLVRCK